MWDQGWVVLALRFTSYLHLRRVLKLVETLTRMSPAPRSCSDFFSDTYVSMECGEEKIFGGGRAAGKCKTNTPSLLYTKYFRTGFEE